MTNRRTDLFSGLGEELRQRLTERGAPGDYGCMLATLTSQRFDDPGWIYERKLDGVRILACRDGDDIRLVTRNDQVRNATWPEIVDALAEQPRKRFVVDGEIVAFSGKVTSFSRLQGRMQIRDEEEARNSDIAVWFYVFDLLHVDDFDIRRLPLRTRKKLLRKSMRWRRPLRFLPHRNEDGIAYWRNACRRGWEGVIAKDASSCYSGNRSRKWLKFKCVNQQEFVIGGYTEPGGDRKHFGALLLGYQEDGRLRYAGRVGTGFDEELLASLGRKLAARQRKTSPFDDDVDEEGVRFVRPDLVGEVGFTEWTEEGRLRHPRFLGLREDKSAEDVVRERPVESSRASPDE